MSVNVYVYFNGNCREAVEYYAKVFNNENPRIMTFGDSPHNPGNPLPEEAKERVIHAQLNIDGSTIMFSDVFPGTPFMGGNNIRLTIVNKKMDVIQAYFEKLKEGGTVSMDLQETFWSKCYGMVTDKFGIHWQLSYENGDMEI